MRSLAEVFADLTPIVESSALSRELRSMLTEAVTDHDAEVSRIYGEALDEVFAEISTPEDELTLAALACESMETIFDLASLSALTDEDCNQVEAVYSAGGQR